MEISNLSDAEFKTLVIRMPKEFTGHFNSIKNTQAEMKIKWNLKNLQVGDEAGNQISDLEHKEEEAFKKKKRI